MLHGPDTRLSPRIIKNQSVCKKKFPKNFCDSTTLINNSYNNIIIVI